MEKLTMLEKLEWALMTLRDQLTFNLPPEQAAMARERRVKGVLADVVKEIKKNQEVPQLSSKELSELCYLVGEKTGECDFDCQDQDRQDFLNSLESKLQTMAKSVKG